MLSKLSGFERSLSNRVYYTVCGPVCFRPESYFWQEKNNIEKKTKTFLAESQREQFVEREKALNISFLSKKALHFIHKDWRSSKKKKKLPSLKLPSFEKGSKIVHSFINGEAHLLHFSPASASGFASLSLFLYYSVNP